MSRHHLLNLPPEIIHIIMGHMDPATFYILLRTCRTFQKTALCSSHIITRHLNNLPGWRLPPLSPDYQGCTSDLLMDFARRAEDSLCTAGVLNNVKLFTPTYNLSRPDLATIQSSRKTDPETVKVLSSGRAHSYSMSSAVFSAGPAKGPQLLARVDENEAVNVYLLADEGVSLIAQLWHILPDALERSDSVVMKMAFSANKNLAVLYKPRTFITSRPRTPAISSPLSERPEPIRTLKLVTFEYEHVVGQDPIYLSSRQDTRDIYPVVVDPVSLAIASNGHACVSWDTHHKARTELWFIGRRALKGGKNLYDSDPPITVIRIPIPGSDPRIREVRPVSRMEFIEESMALNVFELGGPIHQWYIKSTDPNHGFNDIFPNSFKITVTPCAGPEKFIVGVPFWGGHSGNEDIGNDYATADSNTGLCMSWYLSIGMSRTVGSKSVFIVHGTQVSPNLGGICHHAFDKQIGMQCRSWRALALLAGWGQSMSSLGTVTVISPRGNRIAAANWNRVLVWTFDPLLLHHASYQRPQDYFPARDYDPMLEIGRLRPVELSNQGVVYSLQWTSDNVLFATTEHGLVQWDMFRGNGKTENLSLDPGICNGTQWSEIPTA